MIFSIKKIWNSLLFLFFCCSSFLHLLSWGYQFVPQRFKQHILSGWHIMEMGHFRFRERLLVFTAKNIGSAQAMSQKILHFKGFLIRIWPLDVSKILHYMQEYHNIINTSIIGFMSNRKSSQRYSSATLLLAGLVISSNINNSSRIQQISLASVLEKKIKLYHIQISH